DQFVAPSSGVRGIEPAHDVGADQLVPPGLDAVDREIARRPVEISVRQIHRLRRDGASCGRVDGEAAGVSEEVEYAPATSALAHHRAERPVTEKTPGAQKQRA